ncbi:MAG: hypothetical protein B7Y99_03165 [Caulobacterales bacterium 32-69-10]|nr:MAG: hypothetical protein B7Y99_03165 [Caulobacterales bacterium 32-69-10]
MSEQEPDPPGTALASAAGEEALQTELQARIAEAEWLKSHYEEQLRAAFAQIGALQARVRAAAPPESAVARQPEADAAELAQLRAEVKRLSAAEARYLDRIEELKEAIDHER